MRFLVTGATGFVGQHVCQHLLHSGHTVTAVSSSTSYVRGMHAAGSAQERLRWAHVPRGVIDPGLLAEACRDVDVVVHLGARAHVLEDQGHERDDLYLRANVDATMALAVQALAAGVGRFVFMSSIGVNGDRTHGRPFHHDDPPAPHDSYSRSKLAAERALAGLFGGSRCALVTVRSPLVYGAGVKGNLLNLLKLVAKGWPLPFGRIENRRSFIGARNLADFLAQCAVQPAAAGQTLLVSDGVDISTTELIRMLAKGLGVKCRLVNVPLPVLEAVARVVGKGRQVEKLCGDLQVDSQRSQQLLQWSPKVPLAEGLADMTRWYRRSILPA